MVFKTTCVGSIPATLVIVNFSYLIKNKYSTKSFTSKISQLTPVLRKNSNRSAIKKSFNYRGLINPQSPVPYATTAYQGLLPQTHDNQSKKLVTNYKFPSLSTYTSITPTSYATISNSVKSIPDTLPASHDARLTSKYTKPKTLLKVRKTRNVIQK